MHRQNEVKVFRPNSKQADFTVRHPMADKVIKKLGEVLDPEASKKAAQAFKSLQDIGAESLAFRYKGRKIKVEVAQAA